MNLDTETLRTLCWVAVLFAAIQGVTVYCTVRLLVTGRGVFERRAMFDDDRPPVHLHRG